MLWSAYHCVHGTCCNDTRSAWSTQTECSTPTGVITNFSTGYAQDLMDELFEVHAAGETSSNVAIPDFLCCEFEQPDKIQTKLKMLQWTNILKVLADLVQTKNTASNH